MQTPIALSLAACLAFAGCQVFRKSTTWERAIEVRPDAATRDPDPSRAYAGKLHTALAERGIEHQVVVYQYRYTTRLREEAVGTRTAVVYRDNADPRYPWWLKDDRSNKPVWLPNGALDDQIAFYIQRAAEVIEDQKFPAPGADKATVAFARATPVLRAAPAPARFAQAKPAPVPVRNKFLNAEPHRIAAWSSAPWLANTSDESFLTGPHGTPLERRFRAAHGTDFNPLSSIDRRKMLHLQHTVAWAD